MSKTDVKHRENTERLIHIATVMESHIKADADAFKIVGEQLVGLSTDIKSLLASRSFLRGTWFAVVIAGTLVATIAGLLVAWYRT